VLSICDNCDCILQACASNALLVIVYKYIVFLLLISGFSLIFDKLI
jgi:hypothetical protein